ncbi:MAG: hypothetical protein LC623_00215 [Halobacteriales archaeon]|nr:hypothetical protein [Halobacteriales archaeon]
MSPACVTPLGSCAPGWVGMPPACVNNPGSCPSGYVGVPPACVEPGVPIGPPVGPPDPCPAGKMGTPPACFAPFVVCPPGSVGTEPNCVPTEPTVNCPSICPPVAVPLPSAALVEYDGADATLAKSALSAPRFTVFVGGVPSNVRSVEVHGEGHLLGQAPVDDLVGGVSTSPVVRIDNVQLLQSNAYSVVFRDSANSVSYDSPTLRLWTDVQDYITTPGADPQAPGPQPQGPEGPDSRLRAAPDRAALGRERRLRTRSCLTTTGTGLMRTMMR